MILEPLVPVNVLLPELFRGARSFGKPAGSDKQKVTQSVQIDQTLCVDRINARQLYQSSFGPAGGAARHMNRAERSVAAGQYEIGQRVECGIHFFLPARKTIVVIAFENLFWWHRELTAQIKQIVLNSEQPVAKL